MEADTRLKDLSASESECVSFYEFNVSLILSHTETGHLLKEKVK